MPSSQTNPAAATRVLLIDDGHGLSSRIESALQETALRIETRSLPGYLMALGELGVTDDAPHAIIGPIASLNGDLRATAAALHELAPHTKLIAISETNGKEQSSRAIEAGFDECLSEPALPDDLKRTLALHEQVSAAESDMSAPVKVALPDVTGALPLDTAVLDQIINPRGQVQAAALEYIEQHSGIEGITFTPTAADASHDPNSITVKVSHLGLIFGDLVAPAPATARQLEPWAAWLARWMVLYKQQQDLWFMAMRDELTQAWNRRYFQRFLRMTINRAAQERTAVTLLLFDIDDFKKYNDAHGHEAGDDILREAVKLMQSAVRDDDVVARIGGDEFAVVFWDAQAPRRANSRHPSDITKIVERFRKALAAHKFPKLTSQAHGTLTISGGLASYPWDAKTPEELIAAADRMAFQSKREGKNKISFGPGI